MVFLLFTAAHEKNDIPRNLQPDKILGVMNTQLFRGRFITNSEANTIVDEFADNSVEELVGKRTLNPVNHSFTPNSVGTSDKLYPTKNKKEYCSNFITYDFNKFAHVKDVVVDRKYSRGRKGGENVEDVMNQSEQSEYYVIKRVFFKFVCPELEKHNMDFNMIEMTWKHHLKDWYKGIQHLQNENEMSTLLSHVLTTEHTFTIAVTRYEYANLFHTMTDWYNAFYVIRVFNKAPKDVKILLIDGHPKSQLDVTWKTLFHSIEFIGHQTMSQIKYSELVWNIVGYESAFSKNLLSGGSPPLPPQEFSNFFLHAHGINPIHQQNIKKLNILFLWRRDYLAHPRQTSSFKKSNVTIQRKVFNEEEIFGAVKTSFSQHTVHGVQLDLLTMKQQLEILGRSYTQYILRVTTQKTARGLQLIGHGEFFDI